MNLISYQITETIRRKYPRKGHGAAYDDIYDIDTAFLQIVRTAVPIEKGNGRTFIYLKTSNEAFENRLQIMRSELNIVKGGKSVWCLEEDETEMRKALFEQAAKKYKQGFETAKSFLDQFKKESKKFVLLYK